ncbi:MAG: hypothetical protein ACRYG7_00660 [Janthinobacterium lividum]
MTRPLRVGPDTIRLTAVAEALPGVVVRPQQVKTLQAFAKNPKISTGYYLLPSSDFAIALLPAAGQTGTLSQVRIQLRPSKHAIAAGGLRVRLLGRPAPGTSLVEGLPGPAPAAPRSYGQPAGQRAQRPAA